MAGTERRRAVRAFAPLLLLAATLPLAASRRPRRKAGAPVPEVRLLDGRNYSLAAAGSAPNGEKALVFRIMLSGGGGKYWVTESCNPVRPVVDGNPVALKQCFTNSYSQGVLDHGKGDLMTFAWPLEAAGAPLKPGGSYRLAVTLATDCTRGVPGGPGLFALNDCKTTLTVQSKPFTVTE